MESVHMTTDTLSETPRIIDCDEALPVQCPEIGEKDLQNLISEIIESYSDFVAEMVISEVRAMLQKTEKTVSKAKVVFENLEPAEDMYNEFDVRAFEINQAMGVDNIGPGKMCRPVIVRAELPTDYYKTLTDRISGEFKDAGDYFGCIIRDYEADAKSGQGHISVKKYMKDTKPIRLDFEIAPNLYSILDKLMESGRFDTFTTCLISLMDRYEKKHTETGRC